MKYKASEPWLEGGRIRDLDRDLVSASDPVVALCSVAIMEKTVDQERERRRQARSPVLKDLGRLGLGPL